MCYTIARHSVKNRFTAGKILRGSAVAISLQQWRAKAQWLAFEGHQVAYWTGGRGKPLLLAHGFPTASWDWHRIWDRLAAHHMLIACDMVGFGMSAKPDIDYSIAMQADLQEHVLATLKIDAFDALVQDYGVSVAQELLARQLEGSGAAGLGKAIFLNGGIFPEEHRARPIQKLGTSPIGALMGRMMSRERFGKNLSAVFGPDTRPTPAELDDFYTTVCENRGRHILHKLLHYIDERVRYERRWVGALEQTQNRIGLITGAQDPVSGEHMFNRWVDLLPDARAYLLSDIGHYPHVEAPQPTAQVALQWLSEP